LGRRRNNKNLINPRECRQKEAETNNNHGKKKI
jgi:hypothetical protein